MEGRSKNTKQPLPTSRPIKAERHQKIPSPPPSYATVATTAIIRGVTGRVSPTPSDLSSLRGQISVTPLSKLLEPGDQLSMVSTVKPTVSNASTTFVRPVVSEEEDWRLSTNSLKERLKYLLEKDKKYQDVTFEVVGTDSVEKFRAHKLIMRITSSVFDKLFAEQEGSSCENVISIRGVEPATFKLLLQFIYTDSVDKNEVKHAEALPLLHAARKYKIVQLYFECAEILKANMTDSVSVQLCDVASTYRDESLLEAALDHIASQAFRIFPSDDFYKLLSEDSLLRLLDREDLRIDEMALFESVIKWAEFKCSQKSIPSTSTNLRKEMENLIPKIRFPVMRAEEFSVKVTPTKVLTAEEQVEIFKYLCVVNLVMRDQLPPISFNTRPRKPKKCMELDSDEDAVSDSLSNKSDRHMDITTTEAESETASIISLHSDRSRKKARGSSTGRSTFKEKRRRIDKSVSKPNRTVEIDELFGDVKSQHSRAHLNIIISGESICLAKCIADCSKLPHRTEVQNIEFNNVHIQDFKDLESRKVNFPNLKKFVMNIKIDESINSIISEKSFALEKLLFFGKSNKAWLYDELWSMEIDIIVIVNNVIVLKIVRPENYVTLNKFDGATAILKSLEGEDVKSVVYSHFHFNEKHFPTSVRRMVLLGPFSSGSSGLVENFKYLKELSIVPSLVSSGLEKDKDTRVLTFSDNFLSKDKLRKLGVGNVKIRLGSTLQFSKMKGLYLWRVSWESRFEENFQKVFPSLLNASFLSLRGSPKLLKAVLMMPNLGEFFSWSCDWQLSEAEKEVKDFFISCGVPITEKSFALKRSKGKWMYSQVNHKSYQMQIYSNFRYDLLYDDLDAFFRTS